MAVLWKTSIRGSHIDILRTQERAQAWSWTLAQQCRCEVSDWISWNIRQNNNKLFSKPFNLSIIQVYVPTSASSEEEIDAFYNDLDDAYKQCGSQEMVVVMGDLNAKVGTEQDPQKVVVGKHGLGESNERGDLCVDWCTTHEQVIMNTWFQHEKRNLYT